MKLNKLVITNFRSIEDAEISFKIPCRILVGKNESGKSNILKAASLLDVDKTPEKEDLREGVDEFDSSIESEVIFEFELDEEEVSQAYEQLKKKCFFDWSSPEEVIVANIDGEDFTLLGLCKKFNKVLYISDIKDGSKRYSYWLSKAKWVINESFFSHSKSKGSTVPDGKYSMYKVVVKEALSEEELKSFSKIVKDELHDIIQDEMALIVRESHPKVINWKYEESSLLPDSINIDNFIADPDGYKPLRIMFELAGHTDILGVLTKYKDGNNYHKFNNFLEKVAGRTTEHFREVWKEYKNIEFTLHLNGNTIVTGIKETNTFSFQQRSDGFKRFVTFLLMISATYEANNLKNAVLLIDEPDVSLHPSGIKFLRDELIKISKKNIVIASTHSIFLIDSHNLPRHYIVKKEKEITQIAEVNDENLITEEVIFNALGFSFYETLQKENLVFEGWRDKELFKKALEKTGQDVKILKDFYKSYGITHISGVKDAKGIAPIMELAARDFIIISDSDRPAHDRKKEFIRDKVSGSWFTYKDIDATCKAISGEDFLKMEYITHNISVLKKSHKELTEEPDFSVNEFGVISNINIWLDKKCSISDPQIRKEIINELKDLLFENLKSSNIDSSYYDLLTALKEKLSNIKSKVAVV